MNRPGKVANPAARGQLWTEKNEYFSVAVRAWEFGLAGQVPPSFPRALARSLPSLRMNLIGWCLLTGFLSLSATTSSFIYLFIPSTNRYRVNPEFIGSRYCVPMTFDVESPPAQGQQSLR